MRFLKEKVSLVMVLFLLLAVSFSAGKAQGYYGSGSSLGTTYYSSGLYGGSMYGGLGGLGGLYGGSMYGGLGGLGGLYGGSMYGGLGLGSSYGGSMYGGLGGLGGLYGGSMYGGLGGLGGLYGGSMYGGLGGLGGLYGGSMYGGLGGLGGLYGGSMYGGLGGLGGLYGGSMYGGLGGLGGLYGGGLYGLSRLGLSNGLDPLTRQAQVLFLGTSLFPTSSTSISSTSSVALPNPTGAWSGTWLSYITLKGGIANFNLIYDPLTLTVYGTAGLLLNKLIPIPINVSGLNSALGFTLTGSYFDLTKLVTYYASYTCTLVSPSFMTGNYLIHDALYLESDTGEFNMSLVPVI